MLLICPKCVAQYEVDDDVIPDSGRDVQCAACQHTWFQDSVKMLSARNRPKSEVEQEVAEANALGMMPVDDLPPTEEDDPGVFEDLEGVHDAEFHTSRVETGPEAGPETDQDQIDETVGDDTETVLDAEITKEPTRRSLDDAVVEVLRSEAEFSTRDRSPEARKPEAETTEPPQPEHPPETGTDHQTEAETEQAEPLATKAGQTGELHIELDDEALVDDEAAMAAIRRQLGGLPPSEPASHEPSSEPDPTKAPAQDAPAEDTSEEDAELSDFLSKAGLDDGSPNLHDAQAETEQPTTTSDSMEAGDATTDKNADEHSEQEQSQSAAASPSVDTARPERPRRAYRANIPIPDSDDDQTDSISDEDLHIAAASLASTRPKAKGRRDRARVLKDIEEESNRAAEAAAAEKALLKEAQSGAKTERLSRKDRLPDVEELNSALRAETGLETNGELQTDEIEDAVIAPHRSMFRIGFLLAVVIALVLLSLYVLEPQIIAAVPGMKPQLDSFTNVIDNARLTLEGLWGR